MKVSPLKVVVRPFIKTDKKSSSGLLLPSKFDDESDNIGEIVAVGDGIGNEEMPYIVGDTVKFNPFNGYDFIGRTLIMNYTDVYCKIK